MEFGTVVTCLDASISVTSSHVLNGSIGSRCVGFHKIDIGTATAHTRSLKRANCSASVEATCTWESWKYFPLYVIAELIHI